jgi:hypothetical protein
VAGGDCCLAAPARAGCIWNSLLAVDLLLGSQLTSMPVLTNSSTVAESPAEIPHLYSDKIDDDSGLHTSTAVWDEAPMTLAPSEVA